MTKALGALHPAKLRVGDMVRLVSPASPPNRDGVLQAKQTLESWGLEVSLGDNVFRQYGYLAGTDEERLGDLNSALRDPSVRAIIATRGGKGAYRTADQLNFDAARNDPKFVVGFSEITILHMSLWRHSKIVGLHGAFYIDEATGSISRRGSDTLGEALMKSGPTTITPREDDPTCRLTTSGTACGPLLGGNLDMIAAAAGWALPDLRGAILFIEAVELYLGQVDRQLTMLLQSRSPRRDQWCCRWTIHQVQAQQGRDHRRPAARPPLAIGRSDSRRIAFGPRAPPGDRALGAVATLDATANTLMVG